MTHGYLVRKAPIGKALQQNIKYMRGILNLQLLVLYLTSNRRLETQRNFNTII